MARALKVSSASAATARRRHVACALHMGPVRAARGRRAECRPPEGGTTPHRPARLQQCTMSRGVCKRLGLGSRAGGHGQDKAHLREMWRKMMTCAKHDGAAQPNGLALERCVRPRPDGVVRPARGSADTPLLVSAAHCARRMQHVLTRRSSPRLAEKSVVGWEPLASKLAVSGALKPRHHFISSKRPRP